MSRKSLNHFSHSEDDEEEDQNEDEEEDDDEIEEEDEELSVDEEGGLEFYSDNMRAPTASEEEFNSESDSHSSDSTDDEIQRITNESNDEYINQFSNIDVSDQISKGKSLKNQLLIWDNLLEFRIKAQKMLIESNKFPHFDDISRLKLLDENRVNPFLKESSKAMKRLLDILLEIDSTLDSKNNLLSDEKSFQQFSSE